MDRQRQALLMQGITKAEKLIEIGPSHNPLAPKSEGWNAFSIDHLDQAGLVEKYRNDPSTDISRIEPVDFVWTDGTVCDALPPEHLGTFDVYIASHVIEHVPNLVDFFASAHRLTHANGRMVLAVPDKRTCFDMYRSLSSTGEAVAAHLEDRTRHTTANMFDFVTKLVLKRGHPGWLMPDTTRPDFMTQDLKAAFATCATDTRVTYSDAHAWVFCPASFELILLELAQIGLVDWRVTACQATETTEFHVWLEKGGVAYAQALGQEALTAKRLMLMNRILLELAEQSATVLGYPPIPPGLKGQFAHAKAHVLKKLRHGPLRPVLLKVRAVVRGR